MFEAFFDASDFAEAVLFVPEAKLLGAKGPISIFGSGTFVRTSKLPQRLAVRPRLFGECPWGMGGEKIKTDSGG